MRPVALFLVHSDYDALVAKGVAPMIRERDEDGFFSRVVTVHPVAMQRRRIALDSVHSVEEFPLRARLDRGGWLAPVLLGPSLFAVVFAIVRIGRANGISLVRATDPYLMGLIGWVVARILRVPFAVSLHADFDKRFALDVRRGAAGRWRTLAAWLPQFVLRRADLVLPIRPSLAAWAERHGAPASRMSVIPHGVDIVTGTVDADRLRRWGVVSGKKVISFVGRIHAENYARDLAAVATELAVRRSDFVFVFAGDGPLRRELESELTSSPLTAACVQFLGSIPREEALALRRASRVSIALMGGFSLLEAAAAASPVIAYDVEWHAEAIEDGRTGFTVEEHDVKDVVRKVELLLDDEALAERIGAAAQAHVREHYSVARSSAIKRECYRRLLESSANAATSEPDSDPPAGGIT